MRMMMVSPRFLKICVAKWSNDHVQMDCDAAIDFNDNGVHD